MIGGTLLLAAGAGVWTIRHALSGRRDRSGRGG
jgi:hypothetical protein